MICPMCKKLKRDEPGEFLVAHTDTQDSSVMRYRVCNHPLCGYRAKTVEDASLSSTGNDRVESYSTA